MKVSRTLITSLGAAALLSAASLSVFAAGAGLEARPVEPSRPGVESRPNQGQGASSDNSILDGLSVGQQRELQGVERALGPIGIPLSKFQNKGTGLRIVSQAAVLRDMAQSASKNIANADAQALAKLAIELTDAPAGDEVTGFQYLTMRVMRTQKSDARDTVIKGLEGIAAEAYPQAMNAVNATDANRIMDKAIEHGTIEHLTSVGALTAQVQSKCDMQLGLAAK